VQYPIVCAVLGSIDHVDIVKILIK
jgi:hypothetical protein